MPVTESPKATGQKPTAAARPLPPLGKIRAAAAAAASAALAATAPQPSRRPSYAAVAAAGASAAAAAAAPTAPAAASPGSRRASYAAVAAASAAAAAPTAPAAASPGSRRTSYAAVAAASAAAAAPTAPAAASPGSRRTSYAAVAAAPAAAAEAPTAHVDASPAPKNSRRKSVKGRSEKKQTTLERVIQAQKRIVGDIKKDAIKRMYDARGLVIIENRKVNAKYQDYVESFKSHFIKTDGKELVPSNVDLLPNFLRLCNDFANPNQTPEFIKYAETQTKHLRFALGIIDNATYDDIIKLPKKMPVDLIVLIFTLRGLCYKSGFLGVDIQKDYAELMFAMVDEIHRQTSSDLKVNSPASDDDRDVYVFHQVGQILNNAEKTVVNKEQGLDSLKVVVRAHKIFSRAGTDVEEGNLQLELEYAKVQKLKHRPNILDINTLRAVREYIERRSPQVINKTSFDDMFNEDESIYDKGTLKIILASMQAVTKLDLILLNRVIALNEGALDNTTIQLLREQIFASSMPITKEILERYINRYVDIKPQQFDSNTIKFLHELLEDRELTIDEFNIIIRETEKVHRARAQAGKLKYQQEVVRFYADYAESQLRPIQHEKRQLNKKFIASHKLALAELSAAAVPEAEERPQFVPAERKTALTADKAAIDENFLQGLISTILDGRVSQNERDNALQNLLYYYHETTNTNIPYTEALTGKILVFVRKLEQSFNVYRVNTENGANTQLEQLKLLDICYVTGTVYKALAAQEKESARAEAGSFTTSAILWLSRYNELYNLVSNPEKWDVTDAEKDSAIVKSDEAISESVRLTRAMTAKLLNAKPLKTNIRLSQLACVGVHNSEVNTKERRETFDQEWGPRQQKLTEISEREFLDNLAGVRKELIKFKLDPEQADDRGLLGEEMRRFIAFVTAKEGSYNPSEFAGYNQKYELDYKAHFKQESREVILKNFSSSRTEAEIQEKLESAADNEWVHICTQQKKYETAFPVFKRFINFVIRKQGYMCNTGTLPESLLKQFEKNWKIEYIVLHEDNPEFAKLEGSVLHDDDYERNKAEQLRSAAHGAWSNLRPLINDLFTALAKKNERQLNQKALEEIVETLNLPEQTVAFLYKTLTVAESLGKKPLNADSLQLMCETMRKSSEAFATQVKDHQTAVKRAQEAQELLKALEKRRAQKVPVVRQTSSLAARAFMAVAGVAGAAAGLLLRTNSVLPPSATKTQQVTFTRAKTEIAPTGRFTSHMSKKRDQQKPPVRPQTREERQAVLAQLLSQNGNSGSKAANDPQTHTPLEPAMVDGVAVTGRARANAAVLATLAIIAPERTWTRSNSAPLGAAAAGQPEEAKAVRAKSEPILTYTVTAEPSSSSASSTPAKHSVAASAEAATAAASGITKPEWPAVVTLRAHSEPLPEKAQATEAKPEPAPKMARAVSAPVAARKARPVIKKDIFIMERSGDGRLIVSEPLLNAIVTSIVERTDLPASYFTDRSPAHAWTILKREVKALKNKISDISEKDLKIIDRSLTKIQIEKLIIINKGNVASDTIPQLKRKIANCISLVKTYRLQSILKPGDKTVSDYKSKAMGYKTFIERIMREKIAEQQVPPKSKAEKTKSTLITPRDFRSFTKKYEVSGATTHKPKLEESSSRQDLEDYLELEEETTIKQVLESREKTCRWEDRVTLSSRSRGRREQTSHAGDRVRSMA